MDLETVRICFKKYANYLQTNEKINLPTDTTMDSVNGFSVREMDSLTQTLFMDYVMKHDDKINQTAIPCVLYKHVNTIIRQYIQENQLQTETDAKQTLEKEKEKPKKKGWLW